MVLRCPLILINTSRNLQLHQALLHFQNMAHLLNWYVNGRGNLSGDIKIGEEDPVWGLDIVADKMVRARDSEAEKADTAIRQAKDNVERQLALDKELGQKPPTTAATVAPISAGAGAAARAKAIAIASAAKTSSATASAAATSAAKADKAESKDDDKEKPYQLIVEVPVPVIPKYIPGIYIIKGFHQQGSYRGTFIIDVDDLDKHFKNDSKTHPARLSEWIKNKLESKMVVSAPTSAVAEQLNNANSEDCV
jgi:hypothetical protein